MGRYFIYAIMLYAFVVACYLLWERQIKRKRNAARKKGFNPFKATPTEDIIGKSNFTLRHSKPEATTLKISEKAKENEPIFADENGQTGVGNAPEQVQPTQAGTGTVPDELEDNSGEIDIIVENEPEGDFETDYDENVDTWESEAAEDESASSRATGIGFDELAGMVRTVETAETATDEEKQEAGRVLVEVRKTEIFNQVAPDEPKKKVVSSLMDNYFAAYNRRQESMPEGATKAPDGFDARSFA